MSLLFNQQRGRLGVMLPGLTKPGGTPALQNVAQTKSPLPSTLPKVAKQANEPKPAPPIQTHSWLLIAAVAVVAAYLLKK